MIEQVEGQTSAPPTNSFKSKVSMARSCCANPFPSFLEVYENRGQHSQIETRGPDFPPNCRCGERRDGTLVRRWQCSSRGVGVHPATQYEITNVAAWVAPTFTEACQAFLLSPLTHGRVGSAQSAEIRAGIVNSATAWEADRRSWCREVVHEWFWFRLATHAKRE
jgi:hypothetical protein